MYTDISEALNKILDDRNGNQRATVLFTLDREKTGELCKALKVFADKNINISIASVYPCPIPSRPFEYNFLLDCDLVGQGKEELFGKAMANYNRTSGHQAIVLGRYPIIDICQLNGYDK